MCDPRSEIQSPTQTLDLTKLGDLGYLRGVLASTPRLSDRADLPAGPLTDFWRSVITTLIAVAEQAAQSGRNEHPHAQP